MTIYSKDEKLSEFFERLLKNQPLTYAINNTTIGIKKRDSGNEKSLTLFSEVPPVTGVVRGLDGKPLQE